MTPSINDIKPFLMVIATHPTSLKLCNDDAAMHELTSSDMTVAQSRGLVYMRATLHTAVNQETTDDA